MAANAVHNGQHLADDYRLDNELKDVSDELITLALHLLFVLVHLHLLFNLGLRYFTIFLNNLLVLASFLKLEE